MAPTTNNGPDSIRILVATDNHVGYNERDPVRRDDSWRTFDEVMQIAREKDVDMVLLGGDLFHDNKPSRKAMYQVIRSLRQNCLGMKPCELEFLCDAAEVFEGAFGHVNYEDPDINISIPVFSIHGNHDDPSGDGHFCSLDLLQAAGLVNYFGRVPEADNIEVKPVLLQKGRTKLALFGISNVRDERMHRTFRDNHVKFFRPNQAKEDWFNLLTVHQNHHAHTATSYLPENFLPEWMDLVVWGHEHECLIDPVENPETRFHVMQPGSSVATSLVPGEAKTKQVAVLTVTGKQFEVEKVPLKTVRPFVTKEIVLSQEPKLKKLAKDKDNRAKVTEQLISIVHDMIKEAKEQWLKLQALDGNSTPGPAEMPLPLIRLKVEHSAPDGGEFKLENPQRFSNRFAGKVANTNDVIYFYRKKSGVGASSKDKKPLAIPNVMAEDGNIDILKVEELVSDYLAAQSVKILPQKQMGDAVNQFVSKDDKRAMEDVVIDSLTTQVKGMMALETDENDVEKEMAALFKKQASKFEAGHKSKKRRINVPQPDDYDSDIEGPWATNPRSVIELDQDEDDERDTGPASRSSRGRGKGASAQRESDGDTFMDDFEDEPEPPPRRTAPTRAAPKTAAPAKKASARGGRKRGPFEDSDDDEDAMAVDEEEDFEEAPPPKPKAKPAAPKRAAATRSTAARGKQTTLNFSQSQRTSQKGKGSTQKPLEISDDEISDDDGFEPMPASRTRKR
ncbi:hypothetical protein PpBr36_03100 [Pyricularia pennisetigena]|uniref:hypothetical protein n=1 Tax=Pyricularia pennisetigena TaxID=1578925 RepID=UPI00114F6AFD|nr:hypothetical protein PpBr36_03100 [Pyricularia pennisetigena]TLS30625.1 hypothetical protein PpBr36_03100 [Pyricularia pennisetigena]